MDPVSEAGELATAAVDPGAAAAVDGPVAAGDTEDAGVNNELVSLSCESAKIHIYHHQH